MDEAKSLDEKLKKLFAQIPSAGTIGNITLLQKSGLSEEEYWELRNKLIEQGRIGKGKGKGGSVYRLMVDESVDQPPKKRGPKKKSVENDIYAHFEKWLTDFWTKDSNLTWSLVEKTAHQGKKDRRQMDAPRLCGCCC